MTHRFFPADKSVSRFFLPLAVAGFMLLSSGASYAQVEGCNPKVMEAMQKKAQAQVAADVAVTEQIIDKPDSVLAMTCFNQAAGVSAKDGGDIFSDDFTTELADVIEPALSNFYDDFGDGIGADDGTYESDYYSGAETLEDTYDCQGMEDLWTKVEDEGVQADVPFITMDDLLSGSLPAGAGDDFTKDWNAGTTQAAFTALNTVMSDGFFTAPTIPTTTADTACQALLDYGVVASCP